MNCKPGDIARLVTSDHSDNIGRLVLVKELNPYLRYPDSTNPTCWSVETLQSMYGCVPGSGWTLHPAGTIMTAPDVSLRPLPGIPQSEVNSLYTPSPLPVESPC